MALKILSEILIKPFKIRPMSEIKGRENIEVSSASETTNSSGIPRDPASTDHDIKETEPQILSLHFSHSGTSLKFERENDVKNNSDFVNFNEPLSASVSIPLPNEGLGPRYRKGLRVTKSYSHILNDPVMNKIMAEYEALSSEEKRIFDLKIDKTIRQNFRRKSSKVRDIDLTMAVRENNPKHYECQAYLEQVTKQLEKEGLWREVPQESLESDLFPIDDIRDEDLNKKLEPRSLDAIYNPKKMSTQKDSVAELQEVGLEWTDTTMGIEISDLPQVTMPTVHGLMRRAPWSLEGKIARLIVEGSFLSDHPNVLELFECAYFVSKSIFARELFIQVKYEAFARTPLQRRFRTYSYRQYKIDQKVLKKISLEALKKYFQRNHAVREAVDRFTIENGLSPAKSASLLQSIWSRFFKAMRTLTPKQKSALDLIYTDDPRLTYAEAAEAEGISKDSFQDRVRGAAKKIKDALPELESIASSTLSTAAAMATQYLYNGLYCKKSANEIRPIYKVHPLTNERIQIPIRNGKPCLDSNSPNRVAVRAWAINCTPVPDLLDTEFYLGLIPEGVMRRKSGKSSVRG